MKLDVKMKYQLKVLKFHIQSTVIAAIALFLFAGINKLSCLVFISYWVLTSLPIIIIHYFYFELNKNKTVIIENDCFKIYYTKTNKTIEINKNQIERITFYKSASLDNKGIPLYGLEYYQYIIVYTVKGNLFISNFMCEDLNLVQKQFINIRINRIKGIFNVLPNRYLINL